ncbi:MAG: transposase [Hydrogenophaga sp.]|nr:transposase [Hydrogenophaga sp.]
MQRIYQRARHKFALPHEFIALYHLNPKPLINALFASVSQTLAEFAANPKWMGVDGGKPAFSLVLHTWRQDLGLHIHLHACMACGVLGQNPTRWCRAGAAIPEPLHPPHGHRQRAHPQSAGR